MKTRITARSGMLSMPAILVTSPLPAFAADSIYGKVTSVKSAEVLVLDYGSGRYVI